MAKSKLFSESFFDPTFRMEIFLVWGADVATVDAHIEKEHGFKANRDADEDLSQYLGRCLDMGSAGIAVAIYGPWKGTTKQLSILAHEIFHAVEFTMERRDTKHCDATSEVWAYTLDSYFSRALETLRNTK